jgi:GNAT superfamily N-acetyltransferase
MSLDYTIRTIGESDLARICVSFYFQVQEQWRQYYEENLRGERVTLVAIHNDQVVGYANLVWQSDYEPFQEDGIPEINNMHVLDEYQKQGIGTALVHTAEQIAARAGKTIIGIGVVASEEYAVAQRMYPKLGYVPDGRRLHASPWGDVLYLTKNIKFNLFSKGGIHGG